MKYNTKDIYFGYPTYKVSDDNFWNTAPEAFLKKDGKFLRVNSKNEAELSEYSKNTNEYVTVSRLCPVVDMMTDKKEIPEQISKTLMNIYLMKFKVQTEQEIRNGKIKSTKPRTK